MYGERLILDRRAIFRRFARDSAHIRFLILEAVANQQAGKGHLADLHLRHAFIRLNDRWSSFCRRLLLASALGGDGFSGQIQKADNVSSVSDFMSILKINIQWKDDPPWHVPNEFLGRARRLGVRNITTLNGTIGATPNPTESIRFVRNYFAHANPHTYHRAKSICSGLDPREFCFTAKSAGELTILTWLDELLLISRAASE